MKRVIWALLLPIAVLTGCVTTSALDQASLIQVKASLPASEGGIKFAGTALWFPNSRDYSFLLSEPTVSGVAVLTEKSLLFQQWGGPDGLTTIKQIPLAAIEDASLIRFGLNSRLVVRSNGAKYDSFSSSDGVAIGDSTGTSDMHKTLLSLMKR